VVFAIGVLVISLGAIVAGRGYIQTARRMRVFATTRGRVLAREVARVPGLQETEGRWGSGGGHMPKVTYSYVVDGVSYTSDRWSYAYRGLKHSVAERELAAVPDEVDVHYDPAAPQEAYLHTHTPSTGRWFVAGGAVGILIGLLALLTAL
jgi:hypothetical protein